MLTSQNLDLSPTRGKLAFSSLHKYLSLYFPTFAVTTILHSYSRREKDPFHDKERIGFMTESRMLFLKESLKPN